VPAFKRRGKERAHALLLPGAQLFEPMAGRPMREWVQLPAEHPPKLPRTQASPAFRLPPTQDAGLFRQRPGPQNRGFPGDLAACVVDFLPQLTLLVLGRGQRFTFAPVAEGGA
jgi:hypothetical protein